MMKVGSNSCASASFFEQRQLQAADARPSGLYFAFRSFSCVDQEFAVVQLRVGELRMVFLDGLHHGQAVEGLAQVELVCPDR